MKTTGVGVTHCNIRASARQTLVFSGFYKSHEPPPSGDARGIVLSHRTGHQNGQQRGGGHVAHHCVDCVPGGRQSNTERLVACWRSLVAFMKALDLLNRDMRSVFHRRIAMAIEMARDGGAYVCRRRLFRLL
jgi:hypothetical protein